MADMEFALLCAGSTPANSKDHVQLSRFRKSAKIFPAWNIWMRLACLSLQAAFGQLGGLSVSVEAELR